jgi:hypothetical protein
MNVEALITNFDFIDNGNAYPQPCILTANRNCFACFVSDQYLHLSSVKDLCARETREFSSDSCFGHTWICLSHTWIKPLFFLRFCRASFCQKYNYPMKIMEKNRGRKDEGAKGRKDEGMKGRKGERTKGRKVFSFYFQIPAQYSYTSSTMLLAMATDTITVGEKFFNANRNQGRGREYKNCFYINPYTGFEEINSLQRNPYTGFEVNHFFQDNRNSIGEKTIGCSFFLIIVKHFKINKLWIIYSDFTH